ncbi:MAG: riboflavin synthase [Clostridiales bacterium]
MFTGIIEEKGTVKKITAHSLGGKITVNCKIVLEDTKIGDSIAMNGICLTVTDIGNTTLTADVMPETLKKTSLSELSEGSYLNLERALTLNSRLGGHIVSGHVDGTGKIIKITDNGIAVLLTIETSKEILDGIIKKGSVTIDGISLTVVDTEKNNFTVSLIPHTMAKTNLQTKKIGSLVNLETDIIGKYIKKYVNNQDKNDNITVDFLSENGFL